MLAAGIVGMLAAQTTNPQGTSTTTTKTTTTTTVQQNVQPPGAVTKRFNTDYPNMRSSWTMSGRNYRAEYADANTRLGRAVIYDETGAPVGMEREIAKGEYPVTINEYYSTTYPNETYRVWTIDDNAVKRNYFVTRKSEVIWFDDKGNYTRKSAVNQDMPK